MNARSVILSNIKKNLARVIPSAGWTTETTRAAPASDPTLIRRFSQELTRVDGEILEVKDHTESIKAIAQLLRLAGPRKVIVTGEEPFVRHQYRSRLCEIFPSTCSVADWTGQGSDIVAGMDVGIVCASALIAETGTAVLIPSAFQSRGVALLPEMLVIVASVAQLGFDMETVLMRLKSSGIFTSKSSLVLMTGPSRTSDIEKILVKGVHGPRRVVVVLVER